MSIRIREYDGDPSKSEQHDGDTAAAAAAFDVSPTCRVDYVLSKDDNAISNGTASRPTMLPQRRPLSMLPMSKVEWKRTLRHRFVIAPQRIFVNLFLPIGYPHSTGEGYLAYQFYDSLQGICSYLRGVVSTSAVLMAAGVGDAEATAMSAAMAWAMRDGLGMIGGLLFSYLASSQFDQCVKEYRLFADIINDVGLTLDMLAPYAGRSSRVLYVTGLATVCKTMCGMAAGATKGSITHHFAIRGNMADLNAKESTQETLVSLLGMIMGIGLARYLHSLEKQHNDAAELISWGIFTILTVIHVWANYFGVKLLRLRTLNRERTEVALRGVVMDCAAKCKMVSSKDVDFKDMPLDVASLLKSPHDISESLWSSACKLFFPCGIRLGVGLVDAFKGAEQIAMMKGIELFKEENYILNVSVTSLFGAGFRPHPEVSVVLCVGSTEQDELKAFVHAMILLSTIGEDVTSKDQPGVIHDRISMSYRCVCGLFGHESQSTKSTKFNLGIINMLLERGWECNRLYLGYGPWRVQVDRDDTRRRPSSRSKVD